LGLRGGFEIASKIYVRPIRYKINRLILKRENPALSSWCLYHKMESISKPIRPKLQEPIAFEITSYDPLYSDIADREYQDSEVI